VSEINLVRLFDKARTWKWVLNDAVVALGIDTKVDKDKIARGEPKLKKPNRRGADDAVVDPASEDEEDADPSDPNPVKSAYERAVLFYSDLSKREASGQPEV
jgi:hypothetical protein